MNERIEQYMIRAERYAHDKCGFCGHPDYNNIRNVKFAQLVAQDCIEFCNAMIDVHKLDAAANNGRRSDMAFGKVAAADLIAEDIRGYFGIESKDEE